MNELKQQQIPVEEVTGNENESLDKLNETSLS